nr:EOG090X0FYD [Eulimnadia texana]
MPDGNVNEARKQLVNALGESSKSYFAHLKSWFCMKPLLVQPKVQVVQVVIADEEAKPSVKARPVKSRKKSGRMIYEPMEPIEMPIASFGLDSEKPRAGYCARDNSLPDVAMIHGRILLASWDFGLDQGCDNESVELLLSATRTFLKKLLTTLITTRKGYQVNETKFVHSVGQSTMNPWIHNSWKLLNRDVNSKKTENNALLEEKLKNVQGEALRRESLLLMKLNSKEQEIQDLLVQVQELKMSQVSNESGLRCTLLDPAVNIVIQKLRQELEKTKSALEETQNELSAWKFTPDSNTGKRLMAKCRLLYQENEELGRIVSVGRLAKLEGDLALQRNFSEEMKKSQSELDEFLQELDEDVEGMQSTIYYLQQQLRQARDQLIELQNENLSLRKADDRTSSRSEVTQDEPSRENHVLADKADSGDTLDGGSTRLKVETLAPESEPNSHHSGSEPSPSEPSEPSLVVSRLVEPAQEAVTSESNGHHCDAASACDRTRVSDAENSTEISDKCRKRTASLNDSDKSPPSSKRLCQEVIEDSHQLTNGEASGDGLKET